MFLQHMLAVLKHRWELSPRSCHTGCCSGEAPKERYAAAIIEDDLVDTVIGLGPKLFYNTGISASILILRAKGSKPLERQGKVLFINADRDYGEGRAQNDLRPSAMRRRSPPRTGTFADVDGFAKVVTLEEVARQRASTATSAATPTASLTTRTARRQGTPTRRRSDGGDRRQPKDLLEQAGLDRLPYVRGPWRRLCGLVSHRHTSPDGRKKLPTRPLAVRSRSEGQKPAHGPAGGPTRAEPESSFQLSDERSPRRPTTSARSGFHGPLMVACKAWTDSPRLGMAATWWEESFFELQTAASRGWKAVIEAWLTTAEASQGGQESSGSGRSGSHPDPRRARTRQPITTRRGACAPRRPD